MAKIAILVAGSIIQWRIMSSMNLPAGAPGPMRGMMFGPMIVGILFGCAYPVFLLIWFMRKVIRDEVALWTRPPLNSIQS